MQTWFDAQLDQKILDGIYSICSYPKMIAVTQNIIETSTEGLELNMTKIAVQITKI